MLGHFAETRFGLLKRHLDIATAGNVAEQDGDAVLIRLAGAERMNVKPVAEHLRAIYIWAGVNDE